MNEYQLISVLARMHIGTTSFQCFSASEPNRQSILEAKHQHERQYCVP